MCENVTLVVSSCDKYEDAWYPYFELLQKYWPQHPERIALITETKKYSCDGLNIKTYNYPDSYTWSERLYYTLKDINTKYIIFSLEDFFLLNYVDQEKINNCIKWMENNEKIAECRLCVSNSPKLKETEEYEGFYFADSDMDYRVDTQVALWRKESMMNLLDLTESPWNFEKNANIRNIHSEDLFLWYYSDDIEDINKMVFPYKIEQKLGYGVAWGMWLWNNKSWFEKNGINNVNFHRLGCISKKAADRRFEHLYNINPSIFDKIIRPIWKLKILLTRVRTSILTLGFKRGIKEYLRKI